MSSRSIPRGPDHEPAGLVATSIEHHPDIPQVGPLAGSFTWDIPEDRWTWSEEMFVIHGFAPGEVVPTTDLLLSHKHPEDREKAESVVARFLSTGESFACYHRILDAQSQERHVLVVAEGHTDAGGTLSRMSGFMVDLSHTRLDDLRPAVQEALDAAFAHRGDIDMAKGALMLAFGVDAEGAFDLLRTLSNRHNVKIRDVARRLVTELGAGSAAEAASQERLQALLARVSRSVDPSVPSVEGGAGVTSTDLREHRDAGAGGVRA